MRIEHVAVNKVKPARYNPPTRMQAARFNQLKRSIKSFGLMYPLLVSGTYELIDGHRRLKAVKALGYETVPVIIVNAKNRERIFADVNSTAMRLNGNQNLVVWLVEPAAVTPHAAGCFANWEVLVGRPLLGLLAKHGMSIRVLRSARKVCNYLGVGDSGLKAVARYLIRHKNVKLVESYMDWHQDAKKLERMIKRNQSVKEVKYQIVP